MISYFFKKKIYINFFTKRPARDLHVQLTLVYIYIYIYIQNCNKLLYGFGDKDPSKVSLDKDIKATKGEEEKRIIFVDSTT